MRRKERGQLEVMETTLRQVQREQGSKACALGAVAIFLTLIFGGLCFLHCLPH